MPDTPSKSLSRLERCVKVVGGEPCGLPRDAAAHDLDVHGSHAFVPPSSPCARALGVPSPDLDAEEEVRPYETPNERMERDGVAALERLDGYMRMRAQRGELAEALRTALDICQSWIDNGDYSGSPRALEAELAPMRAVLAAVDAEAKR